MTLQRLHISAKDTAPQLYHNVLPAQRQIKH